MQISGKLELNFAAILLESMQGKLKRTDTLFHSCKKIEILKGILKDGGFKASYADEKIEDHELKILMVSFSNVALFESESQVFYGKYAIGLSKKWGELNNLEPVIYTYQKSVTGATFMENLVISGELTSKLGHHYILTPNLDMLLVNSINYLGYLKSYLVTNQKGKQFVAYNDREWRYVHSSDDETNSLIFKRSYLNGMPNDDYDKFKPYVKPYTKDAVLTFDLTDIKFIIVDKKSQKEMVYKILFKKYGKEEVMAKIINGEIDILSRDNIWNNL